jgi:hypothetical protein
MSKIHTTLHKKGDSSVEIYPNIESENIPSGAITQDKIVNGAIGTNQILANAITSAKISSNAITSGKLATSSVTTDKINDGAVTTSKLANVSVTNEKIADGSINNAKIQDGTITYSKLSSDITLLFDKLNRTYNVFVGLYGYYGGAYFGNTTLSSAWNNYTDAEIQNAFDFDKSMSDFTNTDLDILALLMDGMKQEYTAYSVSPDRAQYNDYVIEFYKSGTSYQISVMENNTTQYNLQFDISTHSVTTLTNNKELKITLKKAINFDVL